MSEVIEDCLGLQCGCLMGANLANEVADEKFTEATIGNVAIQHCKVDSMTITAGQLS